MYKIYRLLIMCSSQSSLNFTTPLCSLLPHLLNILLQKLSLHPIVRHLPRKSRHPYLLKEPQRSHRALPITHILGLHLNNGHSWIIWPPSVHTIPQIAEPGRDGLTVELFDTGIRVGGGGTGSRNADPVLGGAVLEGYLRGGVGGKVGEF